MKLEDLVPRVSLKAPDVPKFVAVLALREAAIEFCERTDVYASPMEPLVIRPGTSEYDITVGVGVQMNHVMRVYRKQDDGRLLPLDPVPLPRLYELQNSGKPQFYSQSDSDTLLLAPIPTERETLYILYSVKPSSTANSIPDFVAKENTEALVNGAAYRLQAQTRMPWSDPKAAADSYAAFQREIARVSKKVRHGYVGGEQRVIPRAFV